MAMVSCGAEGIWMSNVHDKGRGVNSRYFLYRNMSLDYCASERIGRDRCHSVSSQDGDAFLKKLGLDPNQVGYGYVVMPEVDLAQSAYDRLCKLDEIEAQEDRASEIEAINMTIAMRLGFRVQFPTNYPHVTITTDRFASPYARDNWQTRKFAQLPDYQDDLAAAMSVASKDWDLSLEQDGETWTAVYRNRITQAAFGHKGALVKTVLLSALTTLIKPR